MTCRPETRLAALLWLVPLVCGCGSSDGPELATVEGYVYLDGQPLPDAVLTFTPESGAPSYGTTDEDGYYRLGYSASKEGAMLGRHTVRITTYRAPDMDEEGTPTPRVPEKLPAQYNRKSTLTAEVESGKNTIDFKDLTSEGDVIQPIEDDE